MGDVYGVRVPEGLANALRQGDRAVLPTGTANRNRQARFAFRFVTRHDALQHSEELLVELLRCRLIHHVVRDWFFQPSVVLQLRHIVRVRQEPDVHDNIRINR